MMVQGQKACNAKLEFPAVVQSYLWHPEPSHLVHAEYITAPPWTPHSLPCLMWSERFILSHEVIGISCNWSQAELY